jgi:hypothetical protein
MLLIILLHLIQPVARLYGRLKNGLTPWRKRGAPLQWGSISLFKKKSYTYWSEEWKAAEDWLQSIEKNLIDIKSRVRRGGEFDNWDLEVKTGLFSKSRAIITIEEHGSGKQLLRLRSKPVFSPIGISVAAFFIGISVFAGLNDMVLICTLTALFGTSILINLYLSALRAMNNFYSAFMMMTSINIIRNHITGIPEKPGVIIDEKKFTPNRSGGLLNKKEKERIE